VAIYLVELWDLIPRPTTFSFPYALYPSALSYLTHRERQGVFEARWIPRARGWSRAGPPSGPCSSPHSPPSASRPRTTLYSMSSSPRQALISDAEGRDVPLLATSDQVYARPCGTGRFKLGLNCAPGFVAQRLAAVLGYEQPLWLIGGTVA
jgi:branched-chain amino acid aminotransferase